MIAGGTQKSNPGAAARCIPIVLVLVVIAACGFLDETNHWTEDVQLDDGSVITIKRHVRIATSNSWAGDVPAAHDRRATLRFTEELSDLPKWDVPLTPMVLYQDGPTKEWVIVARTNSCDVWIARGKPFPPYWEYRLTEGQWRRVPLSETSKGRWANLLIQTRLKNLPRHVSVDYKKPSLADRTLIEEYRRVVPDIRRHCMSTAKE
jgi:hypothetical protein